MSCLRTSEGLVGTECYDPWRSNGVLQYCVYHGMAHMYPREHTHVSARALLAVVRAPRAGEQTSTLYCFRCQKRQCLKGSGSVYNLSFQRALRGEEPNQFINMGASRLFCC